MATNKRLIKSNDEGGAGGFPAFNTVLYTANGAVTPITGVGFQPDLVWIKGRSLGASHQVTDSVRTAPNALKTNRTDAEDLEGVQSFDSDGFTLQVFPNENGDSNTSGEDYVAWCWKAGGAAVTNTDGTITSQVSANTEAGFSIVSYTGNGVANSNVGHGLGVAPSIVIAKTRSVADSWHVFGTAFGLDNFMFLDTTMAMANAANYFPLPTNDVIQFGSNITPSTNGSGRTFVAYCFAEVAGFSKFGSYTGTGVSGTSVTTDFEPAFIMVKRTNNISAWRMIDNKRFSGGNKSSLGAQDSSAEQVGYIDIDFNPTNFTINSTNIDFNASGGTYIYMAFANQF